MHWTPRIRRPGARKNAPRFVSANVGGDRRIFGLRERPSPRCSQLNFKFGEAASGRVMNRIYKRLEFPIREM